jgi:hypothetical protein
MPITRQNRDDRHRRPESYWQFPAKRGLALAPLLMDETRMKIRIGGHALVSGATIRT